MHDTFPDATTIYKQKTFLRNMCHPQQEKDMQKTWAVEKLFETGARLEICPRKLLVCLARQVGVCISNMDCNKTASFTSI